MNASTGPRNSAAVWVRSWAYTIAFFAWTFVSAVAMLPMLVRSDWTLTASKVWVWGILFLARTIAGIDCRIEGRENLPDGPCIVACQHQSSYETFKLMAELKRPIFVLKRELVWVPFIGWYMHRGGLVGIDRRAGAAAMRKTLRAARAALADGRQVIIFPQGTRTPRGTIVPYRPGVAALYLHCGVPVIPAALNSSYAWGKSRILKRPGTITIKFLPALPEGLEKDAMLDLLRQRIEDESQALP
jgi:1-acyl-sn-glycerol-3-phosphate acyltransferase